MRVLITGLVVATAMVITGLLGYPLWLARFCFMAVFEPIFWYFGRNPLAFCFPLWLRTMRWLCYDAILVGWKYSGNYIYQFDRYKPRLKRPGLKIIIANHPCNYFTITTLLGALNLVGPRLAVMLKHSHILGPQGAGLWGIHSAVFVNRLFRWPLLTRWPRVKEWLRNWSYRLLRYQLQKLVRAAAKSDQPLALVALVDARWTQARYDAEVGDNYLPSLAREHVYMLKGQSGGLQAIFAACAGLDVEIIDMTVCVNREPATIEGWFAFSALHGSEVLIHSDVVTEEIMALAPHGDISQLDRVTLQDWLDQRAVFKNRLYHSHLENRKVRLPKREH